MSTRGTDTSPVTTQVATRPPHTGAPGAGRPRRLQALRHVLEYALFRALLFPLERLSWDAARRVGQSLGTIAFGVLRLRRRVVLENLARAFPSWTPARRRVVARECYRQLGATFLELGMLPRMKAADLATRMVLADPGQLDQVLGEGRGAVVVTGHLGNWEAAGAILAARGYTVYGVAARQRNRLVDARVRQMRESAGIRILYTDRGLMPIMRALRANALVAFPIDQDAGRDGAFVGFLGRKASAPRGPARFARRAGCPIVPAFCVRQPDGTYRLEQPGAVRVRTDAPPAEAELEALARVTSMLEEVVRRYPEQWFWMHRRWKTRPPEESAAGAILR